MPPDASLRPTPDDSPIIGFFLMFTSNHVKKTLIQYIDLSSGYTTKYSIYKTDSWLLYFRYGQAVFDFHRKKMDAATTAEPLSTALSSASSARYFWNWNKISFCKHTFHNIRSLRECPFSFSYIPEGIYDKIVSFVPFLWISISSEYIVHTKCDFWKNFNKNCKRCSTLFLPSSHIVIQNKFTEYILF